MSDVQCPYCGADQDINHDDGRGYDENHREDQECNECCKNFVFDTWSILYHTAHKADCLNGAEHNLEFSRCYPEEYSNMRCVDCEWSRRATPEEIEEGTKL